MRISNLIKSNQSISLFPFLLLAGIVSREADLFADDIFHYERRIVNHVEAAKAAAGIGSERQVNKLLRLAEMKSIAPTVSTFRTST